MMGQNDENNGEEVANTSPHCYLEALAPELLHPILTYLPDLESLDSLLRASPAAYRLFDIQGARTFEAILLSGSNHTYTSNLIRIIALINSAAFPPQVHDLISFKDLVRHETTAHRYEPPRWVYPLSSLPVNIPTTVLRKLLVTSRKVQCLAFGCLEYYLDRFKSLRPSHPAEFSFDSRAAHFGEVDADLIGPWQEKPANTVYYYPVHDVGPPSWLEQQRILRTFWRIQLLHELKTAVYTSRIVWPKEEGLKGVDQIDPADLYDVTSRFESGSELPEFRELTHMDTLLEHELMESAIQYTHEGREVINESTYWQLRKDWAAFSIPAIKEDWDILDLCHRSAMWSFFYHLSGGQWLYAEAGHVCGFLSPLQHVKFESFRRLGFAVWSTARLAGYGFLLPTERYYNPSLLPPYYEAWRSILTQNERDQVDKDNKIRDSY